MSRITAPASKLSRALGSSSAAASLRDSSARVTGATLAPQYAELLRSTDHHLDSSRGLATAHRPTPQPSLANRPKPLMQTFHSSAAKPAPAAPAAPTNLDAAVLPSMAALFGAADAHSASTLRMPLLPDNYSAAHGPTHGDGPVRLPSIIAADPDNVLPSAPLSDVEGINVDTVDLKFAHDSHGHAHSARDDASAGLIRDLWKGMVEDVLGPTKK